MALSKKLKETKEFKFPEIIYGNCEDVNEIFGQKAYYDDPKEYVLYEDPVKIGSEVAVYKFVGVKKVKVVLED